MDSPRIVFFGTPEFSIPVLEALVRAGLAPILIVTAPDAPKGRGLVLTPSPINIVAQNLKIPVITPESLRDLDAIEAITNSSPNLFVIAAYGKILPERILEIPKFGTLNVHPSLLPKYRGPSPVASAILAGDTTTGVTIMLTDMQMDHGPILAQTSHDINPEDTALSLTTTLFERGGELLAQTIPQIFEGSIVPKPQDESLVTITKKITKEDGHLDWNAPAVVLARRVRAYTPWPSAWTLKSDDSRLIILEAAAIDDAPNILSGTIFKTHDAFAVRTGEGSLLLRTAIRAGKEAEAITSYTTWLKEGEVLH